MNRSFLFTIAIIIASSTIFNGCAEQSQSKPADDADSLNAIPVEVSQVNRGDVSAYYAGNATLEADDEASAITNVRGIIRAIYVREGDYVEAGQILAKLEEEQLQLEVARTKALMDRSHNEYKRNSNLFEKKLISAEAYDNSRYEYESQKALYELASLDLERTEIRAPISGYVSERKVKTGNLLNVNETLFKITSYNPLLAILHIPEHEMSKIKRGQQVLLQADATPGKTFEGKVARISPVVNPQTGTFRTTVEVQDDTGNLKPGMFSRIRVVYNTNHNTLLVPKEAILTEDVNKNLFVIRDNLAFKMPINTGFTNGNNVEILEGVQEGDLVVTIGHSSLRDSSLVEMINYAP